MAVTTLGGAGAQGTRHEGTPREEGVQRVAIGPCMYIPVGFQHSEAKCAKWEKKHTRVSEPPRKGLGDTRPPRREQDRPAGGGMDLSEGRSLWSQSLLQVTQPLQSPDPGRPLWGRADRPGDRACGDTLSGGPTCPRTLPSPVSVINCPAARHILRATPGSSVSSAPSLVGWGCPCPSRAPLSPQALLVCARAWLPSARSDAGLEPSSVPGGGSQQPEPCR